jgi:hypothetical protein
VVLQVVLLPQAAVLVGQTIIHIVRVKAVDRVAVEMLLRVAQEYLVKVMRVGLGLTLAINLLAVVVAQELWDCPVAVAVMVVVMVALE